MQRPFAKRVLRAASVAVVLLAAAIGCSGQPNNLCPPVAESLFLIPGERRDISLQLDPLSIDALSWQSTSCNNDFSLANLATRWFNFNGTGTLVTASLQPPHLGSGIIVYEINQTDACLPQVLSEKCQMYGYDTVSFTAWQTSTYILAVTNMSTAENWSLVIEVAMGTDAIAEPEVPAPIFEPIPQPIVPLPEPLISDPIPVCSISTIFINENGTGSMNASLDTQLTQNSSCLGALMYTHTHSILGNGNISVIDVCTESDWVADIEVTHYDSPESCSGSCVARGEVLFDKQICGSSFSGRFTRLQFFADLGVTYMIKVMSPITPDNTQYQINVTATAPASNRDCAGARYLGAHFPFIVAGNTNLGGLLAQDCQIGMNMGSPNQLKKSLWYKVIGKGAFLRANPCSDRTDFAARVFVHQIPSGDPMSGHPGESHCTEGNLECVGQADCSISSTGIDFMALEGYLYYVVVTGVSHSDAGFFEMTIDAAPNATTAPNIPRTQNEPLEDAFVANVTDERLPTGSDQSLFVGHRGLNDPEASFAIFKFDKPVLDPNSVVSNGIKSAKLILYGYTTSGSSKFRVDLRPLNQSFTEINATMVDRNAVGPLLDQQDISIASFYEFDVTSWVQEMVADGAAEISFSIQDRDTFKDDNATHWAVFLSREYPDPMRRPKLVVTYHAEARNAMTAFLDGDTFVQSSPALISKNHGLDEVLNVQDGFEFGDESIAYLMFVLPESLAFYGTVKSAELQLFGQCSMENGKGMYVAVRDAGSLIWNERTLVFRNRGFTSGPSIDAAAVGPLPNHEITFNVTTAVMDAINRGSRRLTLGLTAQGFSSAVSSFDSRQTEIMSRKPKLIVYL